MNIYAILRAAFLLGLVVCVERSAAQNFSVSGKVYDTQTGQALPAVIIRSGDGLHMTQSEKDGSFQLTVEKLPVTLEINLIGYKTQYIAVGSQDSRLNIQLDIDPVQLNEVRVGINPRINKETPGSVALLNADDIQRGNGVSLQSALHTVPGVRMDQSTLADSRISIRGNGIRSPWGSRAVKIYINDIPVTETDGTTRIEALDVNNIGRAEIIKGPVSSLFGAGTAGVLHFQLQRAPYGERSVNVSGLVGSYGLSRIGTAYRSGGDKVNSYVSYGWQQYAGYRSHSNDMRRFLTGNFQLFPSDRQAITILVNRSTQHSQIPGALTEVQATEDPLQANPVNVSKNAGRYQNWTRIGIGQQYRFNEKLSNSTSIFSYFYDLDHPLPYAYIRNQYQSYGGRTRFTFDPGFRLFATVFSLGGEFNQGLTKGNQFVNENGTEGDIHTNTDYENTYFSLFYQSETALTPRTLFTAGVGINSMQYLVRDYLVPLQSGVKQFRAQASPRIALSHRFHDAISLHASISTGFTPPTTSEIKTADGTLNPSLQAEKALNYELNAKGSVLRSRLSYDLAVYRMAMKGELIAQTVQQGITVYQNAGRTDHRGAELALSWLAIDREDGLWIQRLHPFAAITYSDFSFVDYKVRDPEGIVVAAFDGNRLTGVSPWMINLGIDLRLAAGVYANCNYLFNDRLPLDDGNSVFHPGYHVANAKIGYQKVIAKRFRFDVYCGIDNLLNQQYSSFVALNAAVYGGGQPAYYNPSPDRNGYGGVTMGYLF